MRSLRSATRHVFVSPTTLVLTCPHRLSTHAGLWVFGASPVMAPALLEQIVSDYVVGSGIDPSVLLHVNQTGCTYSPKL